MHYSSNVSSFIQTKANILKNLAIIWASKFPSDAEMTGTLIALTDSDAMLDDVFFGFEDKKFIDGAKWVADASYDPTARSWYTSAVKNKGLGISEIYLRSIDNVPVISLSYPVYENEMLRGVVGLDLPLDGMEETIKSIQFFKTGKAFLLTKDGHFIVHEKYSLEDTIFKGESQIFSPLQTALGSTEYQFFEFPVENTTMFFVTLPLADWTLVLIVPVAEVFNKLWKMTMTLFAITLLGIFCITALTVVLMKTILKPIKNTTLALKNIAEGDGDLTVRLPVIGHDEIAELSDYFNQTIAKIGTSIKAVGESSTAMQRVGDELASNMIETASAIHQINANIEGVKQQTLTQAASVTETASTIEEIVRTIKQLNNSIDIQASSVAQSSSSIEQMVANLAAVSKTLGKTDEVIKTLTGATGDGRSTLVASNAVTKKIAEESEPLMEAASIIQHIASQTNLLAMNAAIEAAHAGEAGKGFAVVADEIRKLAEDSATQGKTITATLKSLSGEIKALSDSSKIVEEKFNIIFTLAEQAREMSSSLTESRKEQEQANQEVLTSIKNINMVTQEVQAGSTEMLKGGEGVAEEMRKLDALTRIITDCMNEMAAGTTQINNAVQEVNELTQQTKRTIETVVGEISKFKVN